MGVHACSDHAVGFHNMPANVIDQILNTVSLADCVRLSATCKKVGIMTTVCARPARAKGRDPSVYLFNPVSYLHFVLKLASKCCA